MTLNNSTLSKANQKPRKLNKAFWVVWAIELWERFGYYGVQAIIALYFVKQLGYSESHSFYIFGSFSAFVYGFIWIGGWIGDEYLGAKRTLVLGAIILMISYAALALANQYTIFYALSGIVVGNALFKANPSSLISKMYQKGDVALDGAMTLYYMAINIGSTLSMAITPMIAQKYGWSSAFWLCSFGLFIGLSNYFFYHQLLTTLSTKPEQGPLDLKRLSFVILGSMISMMVIAQLLNYITLSNVIVYTVVSGGFFYFIKIALSLKGIERTRMLLAFVLTVQATLFFVLYNQMPTSLTFFAMHNVNNYFLGWSIPPAEYQVLNPLVIVIMSPLLVRLYNLYPAMHITKFCIGMSFAAAAFLVLALPSYFSPNGLASPWWMVLAYFLQSTGELLISALGLAMVAELCPKSMSGFVMGIWFLSPMLAGPLGAWVGAMTTPPPELTHLSTIKSMQIYSQVFLKVGLVTALAALLMWLIRPVLINKLLQR
jgi:proton-dependent oligopeptide transporter, POT family